jgi:hypothetical protein
MADDKKPADNQDAKKPDQPPKPSVSQKPVTVYATDGDPFSKKK